MLVVWSLDPQKLVQKRGTRGAGAVWSLDAHEHPQKKQKNGLLVCVVGCLVGVSVLLLVLVVWGLAVVWGWGVVWVWVWALRGHQIPRTDAQGQM